MQMGLSSNFPHKHNELLTFISTYNRGMVSLQVTRIYLNPERFHNSFREKVEKNMEEKKKE